MMAPKAFIQHLVAETTKPYSAWKVIWTEWVGLNCPALSIMTAKAGRTIWVIILWPKPIRVNPVCFGNKEIADTQVSTKVTRLLVPVMFNGYSFVVEEAIVQL